MSSNCAPSPSAILGRRDGPHAAAASKGSEGGVIRMRARPTSKAEGSNGAAPAMIRVPLTGARGKKPCPRPCPETTKGLRVAA